MTLAEKQMAFPFIEGDISQKKDNTSTFSDNLSLPVHRWFRYSAGFSALWVRELIQKEKKEGRKTLFDPFAGSGTVVLEGEFEGLRAIGVEAHPFVARIAKAKLGWRETPSAFETYANSVLETARSLTGTTDEYPKLVEKCFPPETLMDLDALRKAWEMKADRSSVSELTWLALVSILRECSPVGTAQWQYVLPKKSKAKPSQPFRSFQNKIGLMTDDMRKQHRQSKGPKGQIVQEDARNCPTVPSKFADVVVTSPPYINNYDYADATRLEMSFLGQVRGWGDLQETVRKYLVHSCTQTVGASNGETETLLKDPILKSIQPEILPVWEKLGSEKENHGGKKPYHAMVAAYFHDMARVFVELRRIATNGALVCFVVGDSAPYGIYVPVDRWLGELAVSAGFKSYTFEKTRDRNVKWKNRKHRVPLHEGRLWIKG